MNTADSLEYRYIELTDDLEEAGRLLFYTDAFIYPSLFGSADNAAKVMAKAIRQGSYCFAKENIFGAFCENKPAAILCKNPGGECKWNEQEWKKLFREAGIELPHTFDHAAKHYFQPMNAEKLEDSIYVLAVSVAPGLRGQGVGTELLKRFLMMHPGAKVILDTLEDNTAGVALYSRAGFSNRERYLGYSVQAPRPRCIRMVRVQ